LELAAIARVNNIYPDGCGEPKQRVGLRAKLARENPGDGGFRKPRPLGNGLLGDAFFVGNYAKPPTKFFGGGLVVQVFEQLFFFLFYLKSAQQIAVQIFGQLFF
jgi:hypothetical protein